jgi:multiple antibiotic resistance protein
MMIFKDSVHNVEEDSINFRHIAVFPLAIPSIASPGAILAVTLLTDNNLYSVWYQAKVTLVAFLILAITLGLLLAAGRIQRAIGTTGIMVITKIMGMLLCSLATESILSGIKAYYAQNL